ncbi:nitrate reductase molybdenum cofactor assembly chaperone [Luteococcus sp. OSA5]|uniref:nitrate reductase molybdenum cofactor assembly chaperone n=1 Tax=unclassified Luteococcus TaxID=2639923 RepID=UPI003B42A328
MTAPSVTPHATRVMYQVASLLLSYPDEELLERLPVLREAIAETQWSPWFEATLAHLQGQPLTESQSFHVAEFDISRRHALHLSYWTDGDTRRRGEVLAGIKQIYRDSGLLVDLAGELPDHLPLVLEFAALGDPERGTELLTRYRPSLELLRMQLERDELPQAGILQAICATLPGRSPSTRAEVQAMVDAAMPTENVGLEGYGGPQFVELERR